MIPNFPDYSILTPTIYTRFLGNGGIVSVETYDPLTDETIITPNHKDSLKEISDNLFLSLFDSFKKYSEIVKNYEELGEGYYCRESGRYFKIQDIMFPVLSNRKENVKLPTLALLEELLLFEVQHEFLQKNLNQLF